MSDFLQFTFTNPNRFLFLGFALILTAILSYIVFVPSREIKAHRKVLSLFFLSPKRLTKPKPVRGLPFHTKPSFPRLFPLLIVMIFGPILMAEYLPPGAQYFWPATAVWGWVCYKIMTYGGITRADAHWEDEDEALKQSIIEENERVEAEAQHASKLARDNARYAKLDDRTPEEITEAARRVAEEIKKGV